MAASYKLLEYLGVVLGFLFILLAIASISTFSVSLPLLIAGWVFVGGGIAGLWQTSIETMKKRKAQKDEDTKAQNRFQNETAKAQNEILLKVSDVQKIIDAIAKSGTYLVYNRKEQALIGIEDLRKEIENYQSKGFLPFNFINEINSKLDGHRQFIANYNRVFVNQRKREYANLWKKDNIVLDDEQQTAIVTDEKNNLVVAAAGSGKTEVLITRIRYLTARKPDTVQANRILAIAYQNKDVDQIKKRLKKYDVLEVKVKTFHSLGLEILAKANQKRRSLNDKDRKEIIKCLYEQELKNRKFYDLFLSYVKSFHDTTVSNELASEVDSIEVNKALPYTAINNESVQSRAEKEIYDFLLTHKLNGKPIKVEYEEKIEVEVDGKLQERKPDFHLAEYDLYIEHWGLKKDGQVPKWFDQTTEEYVSNKELKKQWFVDKNKLLVETYSFEYDENNPEQFLTLLSERILNKLKERNNDEYYLDLMSYQEITEGICKSESEKISVDCLSRDISNFIKNAKTYDLSPERILQKLETGSWSRKQRTFAKLALVIYALYGQKLEQLQKRDFEDMINKAIITLSEKENLFQNEYDQILVDEYQDITQQSNKLIKAILDNNPECKLFCVGDDWQSIMGFAGSNLDFLVNFEKYYKKAEVTKICTNYRSSKNIVDASTSLIKNNEYERKKTVVSKTLEGKPVRVFRSPHHINYRKKYHEQIAEDCMSRVKAYLDQGYEYKDILILSRFMWIHGNQMPQYLYAIQNLIAEAKAKDIKITDRAKDEKGIRILTVHKAKGLEAKVVFVLNVIKDIYGFPGEIEDNSILEPARENYPLQDKRAEERRLFYVALSRAKEELNIYTWEPAVSEFIEEIRDYTIVERLSY